MSEGHIYRHYKNGLYKLLHYATNEADLTPVVVYQGMMSRVIWVRPRANFEALVEVDGKTVPRFTDLGADHSENDE